MIYRRLILLTSLIGVLSVGDAMATPSQFGPTGLTNIPTAETLDIGNVAIGVWGNLANRSNDRSFVLPGTITLGIGSFWEVYGVYPNLLMNGEEDTSDRNSADIGTKIRFYGQRNSNFKVAGDLQLQRRVSENPALDGTTDYGGRLIVSYKTEQYGIHAYSGWMSRELTADELLYGGGVELPLTSRARMIAEIVGSRLYADFPRNGTDGPLEASIGFQFHLSPYLSINLSGGAGLTDPSPDWRFVFGFSTSSGLGTYFKPVPKLPSEILAEEAKKVVVKPVKITPISPKLVKASAPAAPVSKIEIPVDPEKEEIVIRTYGQIILPPQSSEARRPFIPPPPQDQENGSTRKSGEDSAPTYGFDQPAEMKDIMNPHSAKRDEKLVAYRRFRFPDVVGYFQQGQTELTAEARRILSDVAEQVRTDKSWAYLRIDGYTDGIGSQKYNADLSLRRAIEVATYLINREGIDPSRIFVRGMGNVKQIADNITEDGRKMNRRFEILFLRPGEK